MSKGMNKKLVPKLRFPEFRDAGGWVEETVGSVCKSFSGGTPSTTKKEYYGGDISFIRSAEIDRESTELFLTQEGLKNSATKLVAKGDILFALYGANSGDVALSKQEGAINQAVLCLRSEGSNAFIYQFLLFRKNWIVKKYIQGGQGNLSGEIVKAISVPFPKPNEQQKIASCLSSIDDLITAQTQKVEALKNHKKGLMQQLFPREGETVPRLRFPEFRDAGEWDVLPFKEIAKFLSGGTPSKNVADYWDGKIPWISASSMHSTKIEKSDSYITALAVSEGARIAKKGTLLLLVRGSMLHKKIPIGIAETNVAFNQDVKALELKCDITEQYLMSFLIASEAKLLAAVTATGIGAGKLDTSDLNDFCIRFPLPKEQQKIASCLSSIDELITAQTQKVEALKNHKKGLMQQLFPSSAEQKD